MIISMKKLVSIGLVSAVVCWGCSDSFLDSDPHEFTDAVFWQTAEQAEGALAGAYSPLQDEEALGGEEWCGMEAFSDIGYMNDNYSDFIAMTEFRATQNTENDLSHNSYRSYYKVVKRAGDILYRVPAINMDNSRRTRILGEANFLQAYAYFVLVQRYGGVPLYDLTNLDSATVRAVVHARWLTIESRLPQANGSIPLDDKPGRRELGAQ